MSGPTASPGYLCIGPNLLMPLMAPAPVADSTGEPIPSVVPELIDEPVPSQFDEILNQSVFSPYIGRVQYCVGKGELPVAGAIGSCCTVSVVDAMLGRYVSLTSTEPG